MTNDKAPPVTKRSLAPAVDVAARALTLLSQTQQEPTLSEIARQLDLGKSSCFNVLSVLQEHQFVSKDARFRTYRLGPKLIELGASSRRGFSRRHLFRDLIAQGSDQRTTTMTAMTPPVTGRPPPSTPIRAQIS